ARQPAGAGVTAADSLLADSLAMPRLGAAGTAAPVVDPMAAPPGAAQTVGADSAASVAPIGAAAGEQAPPPVAAETTTVATELAAYRLSNVGAAPVSAEMRRYVSLRDGDRDGDVPVELSRGAAPLLRFRLVVPGDTIALDDVA